MKVVGSLSPGFDTEIERVLRELPNATTPPRQQSRPGRVYYVVPLKFIIDTVPVGK